MAPPSIPSLRTPDSRFANLPNFPYSPHYLDYGNLRMAYIDVSAGMLTDQTETFLCLHGQPTWSYLYRKMIPTFLHHTTTSSTPPRRVVAPDMFGFGRSDKPTRDADYTFTFHRDSLLHFVEAMDLKNITLVVQDWGGILGLTLPIAAPSRYKRLIVMNTSLSTGQKPTQGFLDWKAFNNRTPDMKVGEMIGRACKSIPLSKAEWEAYDAPYPNKEYKGGVRRFPNLVMVSENMEGVDISMKSKVSYGKGEIFGQKDVFMACGMKDPVLGPKVMADLATVWGNGVYWMDVKEGGHFVQEWGEEVARKAIETWEKGDVVEGVRRVESGKAKL
jgi:haloalkane dehalogenase